MLTGPRLMREASSVGPNVLFNFSQNLDFSNPHFRDIAYAFDVSTATVQMAFKRHKDIEELGEKPVMGCLDCWIFSRKIQYSQHNSRFYSGPSSEERVPDEEAEETDTYTGCQP